jgi:glycosyl hydrolase family 53
MSRRFIGSGLLSGLLIAAARAPSVPEAVAGSSVAVKRSFAVGFLPIPRQPLSRESWLETWDELLRHNAEFVRTNVNVDWKDFLNGPDPKSFGQLRHLTWATGMAKRNKLRSLFVMIPTESSTGNIDKKLPKSMGSRFGDKKVRQAFKHCVTRIARDYSPEYLALGNEINTYLKHHPDDVGSLLSLYQEIYKAIKEVSPRTQVTISLQYELLSGKFDGAAQWQLLNRFGAHLDVVAISTYPGPYFAGDPDSIPDDYYTQLSRHSDRPVIVVESGWPTRGKKSHGASLKKQDRFLDRFVELTSGLDLRLWVWWFLHDWDGQGYPKFFKTMGLRTSKGVPKPSWRTWQRIVSRPLTDVRQPKNRGGTHGKGGQGTGVGRK